MQKSSLPVLIVDKTGIIGEELCKRLVLESSVVYISQKQPRAEECLENLTYIPYASKLPKIPDNTYSFIFVVDDEAITKKYLFKFLKRAEKDKAGLIFAVSLSRVKVNERIIRKVTSFYYKKVKVVVFGDIFGENIYPSFIYQAIKFGKIVLLGNGLSKNHPVFIGDVISGIINVAFSDDTMSIFYLFPKHPPTQLSFARQIQKANPTISVDFIGSHSRDSGEHRRLQNPFHEDVERFCTSQNDKVRGKYLLPDNYPLEKKIRELNIESKMGLNPKSENATPKEKKLKPLFFIVFLFSFIFFLTLPLITTLSFSFFGFSMLENSKTAIEKGSLINAQKSAIRARTFFYLAKNTLAPLLIEAKLIGKENSLSPIVKNISIGEDLSSAALYVLDASKGLSEVFLGNSKKPREDFTKASSYLKNAIVVIRQSSTMLDDRYPQDMLAKIKSLDPLIKIAENTTDVLPNIFGFDSKKTYLVLFQNNMELRPGGGFIGSYGLLTLDKGRVADFSIHDVYDADGQLKGHVEPPYPIRRYLHREHWYLRDSNFDVDFAKGASTSALLLNAELGQLVDGVIGIDVSFVKSILSAIGSVYVADYKETVTSSNIFKLTELHAEKNFFPGSRQKKDFLRSLFSAMQLNLNLKKNLPYLALAKAISESISQKHLLFAFSDPNIQDIFTVNNLSGAVWDTRKESKTSVNDYLGINEANLGVNKANYFVKRSIIHNVKINEDKSIVGELAIDYKNTSNDWPGGDYVNYLRVILPQDSDLLSVIIDQTPKSIVQAVTNFSLYESKDFVPPYGLEVEKTESAGKTIYGFLVTIPSGKSKTIEVKYKLLQKISLGLPSFWYNLLVFKQPGTDPYPYSFFLSYPKNLRVVSGSASNSFELATDRELKVGFAQK